MKSFTYVFSSILNTAILTIFAGHGGKQSVELSKDSFLWLSSVSLLLILTWVINILIEKSKPQIGVEFEKYFLHTMSLGLGILSKACLFFSKIF